MRARRTLRSTLAISALLLLALATIDPTSFAQGYLAGFVLLSMVPIGSLILLLMGGLTGGDWTTQLGPVLQRAARCLPLLLVAFIPIILLRPLIYSWPHDGAPGDVVRLYLNPLFFAARTLIGLLVLSLLSSRAAWRRQASAGVGLVAVAVILSILPVDWVLTLPPRATSAAFGLGFGIEQILAALGFCAVLAPQAGQRRANTDLAGLIVSAILGTVYFDFMQFLITWYGNIPDKVHWYASRTAGPWPEVDFAAFALGAAIPLLGILAPRIRGNPGALRIVGFMVLAGIVLHIAWWVLPAMTPWAWAPAMLSAASLGLFFASFDPVLPRTRLAHAP
jgi:hypothetical protein